MLFTIVPIFIVIISCLVFAGFLFNFVTIFRGHRQVRQFTSEMLDAARREQSQPESPRRSVDSDGGYACVNCGASLGVNTEVSPSGDFKCQYCNSWSNVNQ
ncbi:MAG: hypothetical protein NXI04_09640 [Planctomycetaceae bacterium]|nr:hypothetical protein [Planctomycetaceae bacterium]